jgi:U6 snRNA-associated Sm-like protein LSm7
MAKRTKEAAILDLGKYLNTRIDVKFNGGREVHGVLRGYDAIFNLVLDDAVETRSDATEAPRKLGLVVARGSQVILISPVDGYEQIENPWATASQQ